jgi:hypothetical protein
MPPPFPPPQAYVGEVQTTPQNPNPFPWLTHLDRPFMSPFELLTVPSSSPSRLCSEFSPGFPLTAAFPADCTPYPANAMDIQSLRRPFGHLLNFFHSVQVNPPATIESPQLYRLLDYVEVPSPYAGTQRWYNPTAGNFSAAGLYRPPFNHISRFRDPGRLNINTIFDADIWKSAMGDLNPGAAPNDPSIFFSATGAATPISATLFADKVFRSRQGYGLLGQLLPVTGPNGLPAFSGFPTYFAHPFRATDSADQMPAVFGMRKTAPVEAGFLRPDPDTIPPNSMAGNPQPLFNRNSDNPWDHTDRNAYFRYQALQKLGNTFTTHSNVYAVWMTVGYFEVEDNRPLAAGPVVIDTAHPDGLRLGAEIGSDSGEIARHRMFCIIDRSIPVGFRKAGEKLNSDNCVLLKRMIE